MCSGIWNFGGRGRRISSKVISVSVGMVEGLWRGTSAILDYEVQSSIPGFPIFFLLKRVCLFLVVFLPFF